MVVHVGTHIAEASRPIRTRWPSAQPVRPRKNARLSPGPAGHVALMKARGHFAELATLLLFFLSEAIAEPTRLARQGSAKNRKCRPGELRIVDLVGRFLDQAGQRPPVRPRRRRAGLSGSTGSREVRFYTCPTRSGRSSDSPSGAPVSLRPRVLVDLEACVDSILESAAAALCADHRRILHG